MSDILDKIITARHAEEIRVFNPVVVVEHLLGALSERECEVVSRRFGVPGGESIETLEEIGRRFKITRERVRQITKSSVFKLQALDTSFDELKHFVRTAEYILRSYGGALEEQFFIEQLLDFSHSSEDKSGSQNARVCLEFLLNHVLHDLIERRPETTVLSSLYSLPGTDTEPMEKIVKAFVLVIDKAQHPMTNQELLDGFRQTEAYKENCDDLVAGPVRIAREFYGSGVEPEVPPTKEEENRVLIAYVAAAKVLKKNIFNEWGHQEWSSISPKRMNDKIYLILRNENKPLHFTVISEKINAMRFDRKIAKPPSVHNELILDKRFVLVGRGTYALKEWGYHPGTVIDVITELLKERGPMSREGIVEEVLKRRMVRRQTIHLALLSKERFERDEEGNYHLVDIITK